MELLRGELLSQQMLLLGLCRDVDPKPEAFVVANRFGYLAAEYRVHFVPLLALDVDRAGDGVGVDHVGDDCHFFFLF